MATKELIIIAGPTAVGKTGLAIELARHFDTEIISADSRQCYRELNIGVARPSVDQLATVPHHFIASHSIHETVNAAVFEQYALEKLDALFSKKNKVVMVGGTGLYISAITNGLDDIPDIPTELRDSIREAYSLHGLSWLQQEVAREDALFYREGEIKNPHRLMRALEVMRATGRSILEYRIKKPAKRPFAITKFGLEMLRENLYSRINLRVEEMVLAGLLEEVRGLIPYRHLKALQTVGYRELFAHFAGEATFSESIAEIKKNTRQYAKRQMTWFSRDRDLVWVPPDFEALKPLLSHC